MALVESLQQAIDYMEEHLLDDLPVEAIARHAHVSPSHLYRSFMILTGLSIGDYIRRRRLTLAAQELTSTDGKIIDLAYKYGYDTPEAFARAFRRQHGLTPSEARRAEGELQAYNRLTIQVSLKGAEPMKYRIVEREAFQTVGVKRECPCGNESGGPAGIPEFWGESGANGTVARLAGLIDGQIQGVLGITDNYDPENNTIDYWIAAERAADVPEGFEALHFPAAKWAVFEVRGVAAAAMVEAWQRIYSEWIPSNGYEVLNLPAVEAYIDPDVFSAAAVNEIWLAVR